MSHRLDGDYTISGVVLKVTVSPCCWMHEGYGLQVAYTDGNGNAVRSWGYVHDRTWQESTATKADVEAMLTKHLVLQPCSKCSTPHFFNATSNRKDQCEKCFMARLKADLDEEMGKDKKKQEQTDQRMKNTGYTHRVTAWVHPPRGDDYEIDIYYKGKPTTEAIKRNLKAKRSQTLDDYQVHAL